MQKKSNKLFSVEDAENLSINEIHNLYKTYISKSQVELIGSLIKSPAGVKTKISSENRFSLNSSMKLSASGSGFSNNSLILLIQPSRDDSVAESLYFQWAAMPNSATGETVGDTSCFEAQADWLKATGEFSAEIVSLEIRGSKFEGVKFDYPKGNE